MVPSAINRLIHRWTDHFDGHSLAARSALMCSLPSWPANRTAIAVLRTSWSYGWQVTAGGLSFATLVRRAGQTGWFRLAMVGGKNGKLWFSRAPSKLWGRTTNPINKELYDKDTRYFYLVMGRPTTVWYRMFGYQSTELYRHYVRFDCLMAHSRALAIEMA